MSLGAIGTLILGFVLGLFADPIKKSISEIFECRKAKRELYDDLGTYLARVEGFKLLGQPDAILWIEITRPKAPFFDYYSKGNSVILLRTDKTHGIRNLIRMVRALGEAYRPENAAPEPPEPFRLRAFPDDVIKRYKELLASKDLDQKWLRRAYEHHREPISKNAPSLI